MFKINPISAVDSYKLSHRVAYPEGTTNVYSNFTPRSVKHLNVPEEYKDNKIVWFGGQAVIRDMVELWNEEFFGNPGYNLAQFQKLVAPFGGADYDVDHIRDLYELGYLPLEIKTLDEGSLVPVGIPVMTIENTEPRFFWLTNYIETYLSAELWKPSTSATIAYAYRKIGNKWYDKTGANKGFLDFAFHDFSFRGMGGSYDAAKSGAGHLVNFLGTDTIPAVEYLNYFYSGETTFVGASVPAMEHSVQTAYANDYEYIKHVATEVYPTGIVSIVCDGYDYWDVITNIVPSLKDEIMSRQPNELGMSKVVLRPDSGDPIRIITGYAPYEVDIYDEDGSNTFVELKTGKTLTEAEVKGSIQCLWDTFGGTTNDKGFKTLDSHIGLIYGDSITLARADEILRRLADKGFAADNVVFGVGSYTYQYNTRDTLGFAMKATNATINGVDVALWKDPKTDDGTKKSAKGLLAVHKISKSTEEPGEFVLMNDVNRMAASAGQLTTLFKDGKFYKHETLEQIRNRLK